MMFMRGQKQEEVPVYETKEVDVWKCPSCIGWMQKEFTMSQNPTCPFCSSNMEEGHREIHILIE